MKKSFKCEFQACKIGTQKCRKFPPKNFFLCFLSCHYGLANYFEILNNLFFNIIPGGNSTSTNIIYVELVPPEIWDLKNHITPQFLNFQCQFWRAFSPCLFWGLSNLIYFSNGILLNFEMGHVQACITWYGMTYFYFLHTWKWSYTVFIYKTTKNTITRLGKNKFIVMNKTTRKTFWIVIEGYS